MLINAAALSAVFLNLRTDFNKAFQTAPSQWANVAMKVPSTSSQNDYKWLSAFPKMRKWVGDKQFKNLTAFTYTLVNDDWETTIEVDRNHIEDDTLGIYGPQAQMAGFSAAQLPDELVFALLNDGFTRTGYDGLAFFHEGHPVGTTEVSNTDTVPLEASDLSAAQASYGMARTALRKRTDAEGRPLNINPTTLVVPPALEDTARALLSMERLEDGKNNPYRNTAELVVSPWLTSDTAWFLLDTRQPVKPLIYQERKAPVFVQQTEMNNDDVFNRRAFKYGAEARAAAGYAFWQLAYGSTGEG